MCGIVGIASVDTGMGSMMQSYMSRTLYLDTLRGEDATGLVTVPKDRDYLPVVFKRPIAGWEFLENAKARNILKNLHNTRAVIGHNRARTRGGNASKDAHPFYLNNIVLVHNGSLYNTLGMPKHPDTDVDSAYICAAMARRGEKDKSVTDILKSLDGAYALVWYDDEDNSINFAKNNDRSLYYGMSKDNKTMAFASEPWMIQAGNVKGLKSEKHVDLTVEEFNIHSHYSIELGGNTLEIKETKYKPESRYVSGVTSQGNFSQTRSQTRSTGGSIGGSNLPINGIGNTKVPTQATALDKINRNLKTFFNNSPNAPKVGDELEFIITEAQIQENSKNKEVVTACYGVFAGDASIKVIAQGLEYDEINDPEIRSFKGVICQAFRAKESKGKENTPFILVTNCEPDLREDLSQPDGETLYRNSEFTQEVEVFKGPGGGMVTLDNYTELVSTGCSVCAGGIQAHEHEKVLWTHCGSPICPTCSDNITNPEKDTPQSIRNIISI